MKGITADRFIIISTKTILGYFVFFISLFSIPIYNELKDSDFAFAFVSKKDAVIGETALKIEIADSQTERTKGLSGRAYLEDGVGLLFIFDNSDFHGIWMKDMNFAIDIIWLDTSLEIVHIEQEVRPQTYPETFKPNKKALYVLEVPYGFVSDNHLKLGDQMTIL